MGAQRELAHLIADELDDTKGQRPARMDMALAAAILAGGYSKPRTVTTAEEIRGLSALDVVIHDDLANGGELQAFVVPDDGTVMFPHLDEFHLMTFAGDYVDAKDMPLPLTVVYSGSSL